MRRKCLGQVLIIMRVARGQGVAEATHSLHLSTMRFSVKTTSVVETTGDTTAAGTASAYEMKAADLATAVHAV